MFFVQLLQLGHELVLCLNMTDEAEKAVGIVVLSNGAFTIDKPVQRWGFFSEHSQIEVLALKIGRRSDVQ